MNEVCTCGNIQDASTNKCDAELQDLNENI